MRDDKYAIVDRERRPIHRTQIFSERAHEATGPDLARYDADRNRPLAGRGRELKVYDPNLVEVGGDQSKPLSFRIAGCSRSEIIRSPKAALRMLEVS